VIVAIRGGDIRTRGTSPTDREIIRLSRNKHPKFLFISTSSSDSKKYWTYIQEYFGGFLKRKDRLAFPHQGQPFKRADPEEDFIGGASTLKEEICSGNIWEWINLSKKHTRAERSQTSD
jgi:hypothetical protein